MPNFFYAVGESLLGGDKHSITTGDITCITSFGVWVLDIRFITPQISPVSPFNVIYIYIVDRELILLTLVQNILKL